MKKSLFTAIIAFFAIGTATVYGQFVYDANGNATIDRVGTSSATSVTINNSTPGLYKSSTLNIGDYTLKQAWGGPYNGTGSFVLYNSIQPSPSAKITMYNGRIGFAFNTVNLAWSSAGLNSPARYLFDTLSSMNRLHVGDLSSVPTFPFVDYNFGVNGNSLFKGKVAIGVTNNTLLGTHKLYVGGSIICEELVVKLQANWPDYVFAPSYKLMPLSQVKTYIAANNHLPDVPAACEVTENGVETGEMLTIQMKKIEELTLYLIQMEERIKELEAKNKALQNSNGQ